MPKLRSSSNHHSLRHCHLTKSCRKYVYDSSEIFGNRGNLLTMIRFYAGHECLWNCMHEDYYNERKRRELWCWIARQFGGRLSPSHVEYHMKFLHAKALQVFKGMDRCRRMGVRFRRPTFDLLDEFNFLLQEPIPQESISNITAQEVLHRHLYFCKTKKDSYKGDLNVFCKELKRELKHLPQNTCRLVQRKIFSILASLNRESQLCDCTSSGYSDIGFLNEETLPEFGAYTVAVHGNLLRNRSLYSL